MMKPTSKQITYAVLAPGLGGSVRHAGHRRPALRRGSRRRRVRRGRHRGGQRHSWTTRGPKGNPVPAPHSGGEGRAEPRRAGRRPGRGPGARRASAAVDGLRDGAGRVRTPSTPRRTAVAPRRSRRRSRASSGCPTCRPRTWTTSRAAGVRSSESGDDREESKPAVDTTAEWKPELSDRTGRGRDRVRRPAGVVRRAPAAGRAGRRRRVARPGRRVGAAPGRHAARARSASLRSIEPRALVLETHGRPAARLAAAAAHSGRRVRIRRPAGRHRPRPTRTSPLRGLRPTLPPASPSDAASRELTSAPPGPRRLRRAAGRGLPRVPRDATGAPRPPRRTRCCSASTCRSTPCSTRPAAPDARARARGALFLRAGEVARWPATSCTRWSCATRRWRRRCCWWPSGPERASTSTPSLDRRVDSSFRDVRLDDAVDLLLDRNGMRLVEDESGIYFVEPADGSREVVASFQIESANARPTSRLASPRWSPTGTRVIVDPDRNLIVVRGREDEVQLVADFLADLRRAQAAGAARRAHRRGQAGRPLRDGRLRHGVGDARRRLALPDPGAEHRQQQHPHAVPERQRRRDARRAPRSTPGWTS